MKKKLFLFFAFLFAVALTALPLVDRLAIGPVLSEAEVQALRERYPTAGGSGMELMSVKDRSFEERLTSDESLVYAEVISDRVLFNVSLSEPDNGTEGKLDSENVPEQVEYFYLEIKVIKDARRSLSPDTIIRICTPSQYVGGMTFIHKGDRIVVPLIESSVAEGYWAFSPRDIFYVTEDEFLMSNFKENGTVRSGRKVDSIMREFG